ncbi:inositol-1-monophosphatase [Aureococcus anophagefferens]|nr:inositol-1-monophosphatase [Aureococcus anophagefferens]
MAAPGVEVPGELVAFAGELADAAGAVILKYWRKPIEVVSKIDAGRPVAESPVTAADRGAEEAMRALIAARYPRRRRRRVRRDGRPGDRRVDLGPGPRRRHEVVHHGQAALRHVNRAPPLQGAGPRRRRPVRVAGALGRRQRRDDPQRRARARARAPRCLGEAMVYATTPEMFAPGSRPAPAGLAAAKRTLYGCDCYAYALCASGFVGLVCEADLQPYDYLALVPVVAGAGGKITDWRGAPLGWGDASGGRVLAAATPKLHAAALAALAKPPRDDRVLVFAAGAALGALLGALAARARR